MSDGSTPSSRNIGRRSGNAARLRSTPAAAACAEESGQPATRGHGRCGVPRVRGERAQRHERLLGVGAAGLQRVAEVGHHGPRHLRQEPARGPWRPRTRTRRARTRPSRVTPAGSLPSQASRPRWTPCRRCRRQ
ncbi:Os11g0642900 [Oryza sativa Japonica Group]|uniref:Os11g0642900 protein n=2 Tax=Oryza sativa subsp. japonica TaxID=39947 RepID=Q0IRE5_ORYSJ|nr:hypothetical protein EE612_056860 [Oryza sativa]BAF28720.1 Os11g0642900 [Oryza sativa Japonica Group]BAT15023.1 Os11g0642900 [Oryza sativa Japonica Group]|eukprot:NP_001068357.1 Os11g0642900 [Oryza sativa Japonica Group]